MRVASFYGESPYEIVAEINRSAIQNPSLGIIFSSISLGIPDLSHELIQYPFPLVGCSSSGEIRFTRESTPVSELSAVGVLMDPGPDSFRVSLFPRDGTDSSSLGMRVGRWGSEQFENPIFLILISGLKNNQEQIIRGIERSFPAPPPVYGGIAGDDGRFEETYVFLNGTCSSDGVAAIVLDSSVHEVSGLITSGWREVGVEKRITRSDENVVYTIDERPALDLYTEYLNLKEEDIPRISMDFPLIVKRRDGTMVIRVPIDTDRENRALIFAAGIPEGAVVTFSSSPGLEMIQNSIADISASLGDIQNADLILVFSCVARLQVAGEHAADEIVAAAGSGDNSLIGFFCYGEIRNNSLGNCEYYNETFNLVTLTEKRIS